MKTLTNLLVASVVVGSAVAASAQPFFTQGLDTTTNSVGVRATYNPTTRPIVGDDWVSATGGSATEIAIWGSWLNDVVDPNVTFKLSIHRDNPPGSGSVPWSRPGQEIWSYIGAASDATLKMSGINGSFYDFTTGNSGVFSESTRYLFNFGAGQAFNAQAGVTYWLVVQAQTTGGRQFAWNSSWQHYADAAVFGNNTSFGSTRVVFNPMTYGQAGMDPALGSIDLAFTIAPEPSTFAVLGLGLAALLMRRKLS